MILDVSFFSGDLDLVKFFISKGMGCNVETMLNAAKSGNKELVDYILLKNNQLTFLETWSIGCHSKRT